MRKGSIVVLKQTSLLIAVLSLVICLVSAVLVLLGKSTMEDYKQVLLFGSVFYIIFATVWATRAKPSHDTSTVSEDNR